MENKNKRPGGWSVIISYLITFAMVALLVSLIFGGSSKTKTVSLSFSDFVTDLAEEKVSTVTISESSRSYTGSLKDGTAYIAYAPTDYDMALISEQYIIPQSSSGVLKVSSVKPSNWLSWISLLPTVVLLVLMVIMIRNMNGGGNKGVMSFGKSRARVVKEKSVTFDSVGGLEEEKKELSEIVDFLKNPKKYRDLGARIPKGVLLVGPPGTGKTFISKAVAGEAGVPFFSISGSDFVEMFVGVGASRVRDLFDDAKHNSPCIIFIDEIDAVGRRRGAGIGGGNDEREQTLNQLLVEMDGFDVNEGIIILAATNRPDVLDPALLRPGRFDRQVVISVPDIKGREQIFGLYSKNKPIGDDVDMSVLAKRTPGFTPADIENMMNEAALLTARRDGTQIHMDDLEEAITRVIVGPQKTSHVMSDKEKRLTAYHEAGHAVIQKCLPDSDPVHQVTIMPRGSAGGFTMTLPEEDRYYATQSEMENEIIDLLGGRLAETIIFKDVSTGASNDLERATKIAHDMVTKYGMSKEIGPVNYSDNDEVFLGRDFTSRQNYSEELAGRIDKEVRKILDAAFDKGMEILKAHSEQLERVAAALLELETLDEEDFNAIFDGSKTAAQIAEDNKISLSVRHEKEEKERIERREKEEKEKNENNSVEQALKDGKRVVMKNKDGTWKILKEMTDEMLENPFDEEEKAAPAAAPASAKKPDAQEPPAAPEAPAVPENTADPAAAPENDEEKSPAETPASPESDLQPSVPESDEKKE